MPVIQINVFLCEVCGAIETKTEETSLYSDPVVTPPSVNGAEWDITKSNKLGCPKCVEKDLR